MKRIVTLLISEVIFVIIYWGFLALVVNWWLALLCAVLFTALQFVYFHIFSQVKDETSKM